MVAYTLLKIMFFAKSLTSAVATGASYFRRNHQRSPKLIGACEKLPRESRFLTKENVIC
jgi:hypothetical protein